jgi:hypothetical protein
MFKKTFLIFEGIYYPLKDLFVDLPEEVEIEVEEAIRCPSNILGTIIKVPRDLLKIKGGIYKLELLVFETSPLYSRVRVWGWMIIKDEVNAFIILRFKNLEGVLIFREHPLYKIEKIERIHE